MKLPSSFTNATTSLSSSNSQRQLTQLAQLKKPQPIFKNEEEDDIDYIRSMGFAFLEVVIRSTKREEISTGILVGKGGEKYLTATIHCWDAELKSKPKEMGDPCSFILTQGEKPNRAHNRMDSQY